VRESHHTLLSAGRGSTRFEIARVQGRSGSYRDGETETLPPPRPISQYPEAAPESWIDRERVRFPGDGPEDAVATSGDRLTDPCNTTRTAAYERRLVSPADGAISIPVLLGHAVPS
jgi:hypothetical protein